MKKIGFTLMEVLITLGIIGVIASLTLPSVILSTKNETYGTMLSTTVASVENAFTAILASEGATDLYHTSLWQDPPISSGNNGGLNSGSNQNAIDKFAAVLGKYLVNSGYDRETMTGYYTNNGATIHKMTATGKSGEDLNIASQDFAKAFPITLKSGAVVFFNGIGEGTSSADETDVKVAGGHLYDKSADIIIDVNGASSPNVVGRDIFRFYMGQDGILYPIGGLDAGIFDKISNSSAASNVKTWHDSSGSDSCVKGSIKTGWGCTARLADENYKMNY